MLPRIGAKMIAAENDPGGVKTDARARSFHETAEIGGRHASVAALLVDLIAGRLDEDSLARAKSQRQGGFDDEGWAVQTEVTPALPPVSRSLTSGGTGRVTTGALSNGFQGRHQDRLGWRRLPSVLAA